MLVDMRCCVFDALCNRFGACLVGDDGPPPVVRVHNNQIVSHGEDRGGDNSEGDDEGGKGSNGGRGYEDDGEDGNDDGGNCGNGSDDDGDGSDNDKGAQQSNIKPR